MRGSYVLRLRRLQFVQPQLQLLDLTVQLLRLTPELHPPQLGDQQLQVLDLVVARQQLFVLGQDQCFQCGGIKLIQIGESARAATIAVNLADFCYSKIKMRAKTKNISLTPPSAARNCAPVAANRSLPGTSRVALG